MLKRYSWFLVLGACAFAGSAVGTMVLSRMTPRLWADSPGPDDTLLKLSDRFEKAAHRVLPAVVSIEATKTQIPGRNRPLEESGSGVIIRGEAGKSVYVITNNHVVSGANPEQITVTLSNGRVIRPSQAWTDPESDVAVLRLDKADLPTATFGDSDKCRIGQWVLAIGSPFGLNQSVTHGIISARERGQISLGGTIRIKDFLQTDAAINPGSSGGPLINLDGEVIGINTAIASQSNSHSGVSFSIPVNMVRKISRQLLEKGSVTRGFLGLHLASAFEPSDALKLGMENANGALVSAVYPETPAAAAGLKPGDVILKLNETAIRNENQLINLISSLSAGQRVKLHIWRDKHSETVDATIGDWQQAQTRLKPASMK